MPGAELERGSWQLAWSQAVPRSRWLAAKLGLIMGALVMFGVAVTLVLTWSRSPLDRVSIRLQPPPFNFEGIQLPCELLCGSGLALLAGLLLRNTIGAMVAAYFAWEAPFVAGTLRPDRSTSSPPPPRPSRYLRAGLTENLADARAGLRWLAVRFPGLPLLTAGLSEGTWYAARLAADGKPVAGTVLLGAPARTGEQVITWQIAAIAPGASRAGQADHPPDPPGLR